MIVVHPDSYIDLTIWEDTQKERVATYFLELMHRKLTGSYSQLQVTSPCGQEMNDAFDVIIAQQRMRCFGNDINLYDTGQLPYIP